LDDKNKLFIIKKYHKFDFTVALRLSKLLSALSIDIVHSYLFDADIAARIAGRMAKTRLIINSERNANYSIKKIQSIAYTLTHNKVDYYIANSVAGAKFNSAALGYDEDRYRVVYNGVNAERFSPLDEVSAIRKKYQLPEAVYLIGMFASIKYQKNHPMILRCAKQLVMQGLEFRLVLVGDQLYGGMHGSGEYANGIKKYILSEGLSEYVIMLGNQEKVEELYNACDITVLPSYFEGMPNVALESMACGVPVVATDVSDNALIIKSSHDGMIVELNNDDQMCDAILKLKDDSFRQKMSTEARKTILDKFSNTIMASNTESVYLELLDKVN
ncbi:MAG: glycosyltransferase, partial [Flavobacteriaceae bacterium]|nr:glycosyltransferase [Flavobacteriaceae bacterium]